MYRLHQRGWGELKAPGKSGSEEPGGIWNPAGAREHCVCLFSLYPIVPRGGVLISSSGVLGITSSVATRSPSWGTRDRTKQAGVSVGDDLGLAGSVLLPLPIPPDQPQLIEWERLFRQGDEVRGHC